MDEERHWPAGDGEMAPSIREKDWAATPLGAIENWPQSLKTAVDTILGMLSPAVILWGPQHVQIYNDGFVAIARERHPSLLGQPAAVGWADVFDEVLVPLSSALAGKATQLRDYLGKVDGPAGPERRVFDADWSPLRDESGEVVGALQTLVETTDRHRTEGALRESEERQAFLLSLSDRLRNVGNSHAAMSASAEMFGKRLGLAVAHFLLFEPDEDRFTLGGAYSDGRIPAGLQSSGRLSDHGPGWGPQFRAGEAVFSDDHETRGGEDAEASRSFGVRSGSAVPLIRDGRMVAIFSTAHPEPRHWTEAEKQLQCEVAHRTWAAVERARAELALRDSEEKYRSLFESMDQGFCIIERVPATDERPVDFRYVAANPAFERHTGMHDVIGRTIRELVPGAEQAIMDIYDEVARNGQPRHFEGYVAELNLWIDTEVVPAQRSGQVAVLFSNVSDRKHAEAALRESDERFREFGEASQDVLWTRDAETLCWTYLSAGFERTYGANREDALSDNTMENWLELIVPDDRKHALDNIRKVRDGERVGFEYRIRRPDGAIRWIRDTDFPMRDSAGKVVRIGGIGQDITALKQAEEHHATLLAELQHRVRNTLAVVRSIARRTADNSDSADDMLAHFLGRLDAFSRVQAALTRNPETGVELMTIVEDELVAHAAREGERVRVRGPEVMLPMRTAESMSLAIHELATNAVKHGALSGRGGKVAIEWKFAKADGRRQLLLTWKESGVSVDEPASGREGFGMELLRRSLPYDLQAETEVAMGPSGMQFELRMPLPAVNG